MVYNHKEPRPTDLPDTTREIVRSLDVDVIKVKGPDGGPRYVHPLSRLQFKTARACQRDFNRCIGY